MRLTIAMPRTLLAVALVVLAACGNDATATPQPSPTATPQPPAAATLEQLNDAYTAALKSGDLAAFTSILADDFVFTQVPGSDGTKVLTVNGKSAYMVRLAGQIGNRTEVTYSDLVFEGTNGSGKFSLTADNFRALGIDALTGTLKTTASDGKLTRRDTALDATSLDKLEAASAPPAPREVRVLVGAGQDTLSINAFLPSKVTIRAGDTVTWELNHPDEPHTVTFLSGGGLVPFAVPVRGGAPNDVTVDPQGSTPTRRLGALIEIHSGKGYFNSGFMTNEPVVAPGATPTNIYSMIFDAPGVYEYRCLLHSVHRGTITVLPAESEHVASQILIDVQAGEEKNLLLAQAERLKLELTTTKSELGPGGTTIWHVQVGGTAFDSRAELYEFFPKELTIQEGDTVVWSTISPTIHTVTFHPGLPEPLIVFAEPQDVGPVMLTPNREAMFPFKPGGEFEGTGLWGSGLINTKGAAGGNAFTMNFNKTGVFDYKCLVHTDLGMEATITVVPREGS